MEMKAKKIYANTFALKTENNTNKHGKESVCVSVGANNRMSTVTSHPGTHMTKKPSDNIYIFLTFFSFSANGF